MPKKNRSHSLMERWTTLVDQFERDFPHVSPWLFDQERFVELRIKARDDGTCLAIAKGYDGSGGPVVCFGVGYDPVSALISIDSTMQGGGWKVDKPWEPKKT